MKAIGRKVCLCRKERERQKSMWDYTISWTAWASLVLRQSIVAAEPVDEVNGRVKPSAPPRTLPWRRSNRRQIDNRLLLVFQARNALLKRQFNGDFDQGHFCRIFYQQLLPMHWSWNSSGCLPGKLSTGELSNANGAGNPSWRAISVNTLSSTSTMVLYFY